MEFSREELLLISHGLYCSFSKLGKELNSYEKEHKEESEILQRKINREIAGLLGE